MAEVIGVRFKEVGKVYYFDPDGHILKKGEKVIVETVRGIECGEVAMDNRDINDEEIVKPLKKLIRIADESDIERVKENKEKEKEAFDICRRKIEAHGLEMKLVDAEYTFDGGKLLFYFTADGRIDFRELVRDLAGVFKTRIELRQIGVRDEARIVGGLGVCGRPFCCHAVSDKLKPVSIKMAKEQNLSLNSMKISGQCGRLLCCLANEYDWYNETRKNLPSEGVHIYYDGTNFRIQEINPVTGMIKMSGEDGRLLEVNSKRFFKDGTKWKIN